MGKTQSIERVVFVDYIRVIACLLVMLVHASENFYGADSSGLAGPVSMLANESNRFWVSLYDGFMGRISVPLFMIVSAFLLVPLKPGMTMGQFYRRRFMRILPPFIIFLIAYSLLPLAWGGLTWEQSLDYLKNLVFNFPMIAGHLWFMYPLISLYIIIPVVSPWLERASARDERIFLGFFVASTFMPWLRTYVTPELWGECFWNRFGMMWYCSGYLGYLVLAHYVRFHINWDRAKRLRIGALCFLIGAAFSGWSFWWKGEPGVVMSTPLLEWSWEFCTPNVLLASFGAFLLFSCIDKPTAPRWITELSRLSFGMYLMHMFFLQPIAGAIVAGNPASPLLPVWLAVPCIALATFVCCVIATKLLSLLPGSKYTVGY